MRKSVLDLKIHKRLATTNGPLYGHQRDVGSTWPRPRFDIDT